MDSQIANFSLSCQDGVSLLLNVDGVFLLSSPSLATIICILQISF